jgi:hypothetical protein
VEDFTHETEGIIGESSESSEIVVEDFTHETEGIIGESFVRCW